jgi:hypothetical protein
MRAGDVPVSNNMSVRGARKEHPRENGYNTLY